MGSGPQAQGVPDRFDSEHADLAPLGIPADGRASHRLFGRTEAVEAVSAGNGQADLGRYLG